MATAFHRVRCYFAASKLRLYHSNLITINFNGEGSRTDFAVSEM